MITANIEDLTAWIPRFLPLPRVLIVRLYAPGIEPVEPNPFKFAVVAVVQRRVATIKALCQGVTPGYMRAGARALAKIGIRRLEWRHDGVNHQIETGAQ